MKNLPPEQVLPLLDTGAVLLDVREHEELEVASVMASVKGARHIPMNEIPSRLAELDAAKTIAVLCHHGGRSMQVARFLERNGFADVINIAGGIDVWSQTVDTSIPRY